MASESKGTRFFKMSGGGNDFVAVLDSALLTPKTVDAMCARGLSIGADGVFALSRVAGADAPTVQMDYFNADGSPADLCVNGTRCAGLLACHLGWSQDRVLIETGAGPIEATRLDDSHVALRLAPPKGAARSTVATTFEEEISGWFIEIGVPHFVLEWNESLVTAPVATLGEELRHADEFAPNGANVNFVRFLSAESFEIRTFERGVEGETLACGTGVLAACAVGVQLNRCALPVTALTSGGFELEVDGSVNSRGIEDWQLAGDARLLAEGVLHEGAFAIPQPPLWSA